jgi:hypothetical protein
VDSYHSETGIRNRLKKWTVQEAEADAFKRLAPFSDRIRWIKKDSSEAIQDVEDYSLQFVFIDADHTYDAVSKDIRAWLPKVKQDGKSLIAGHDYRGHFRGVTKAVDEFFGNRVRFPKDRSRTWWVFL